MAERTTDDWRTQHDTELDEGRDHVKASNIVKSLQASYAETAQFYLTHAQTFPVGSLGYISNMAESAKYARLAAGSVNER